MNVAIYGIANCDQIRRARTWWRDAGHAVHFVDVRREALTAERLDRWIAAVGIDRLLNRQGRTWRMLDDATRAQAQTPSHARDLMLAHPTLIKRPVVEIGAAVIVGHEPLAWTTALERP